MATFSGLFSARDIWLLQKFTQCHLATEETLANRVSLARLSWLSQKEWWVDGGDVRMAWDATETLRRRVNYKDGKIHGISEAWYATGERAWRRNWKDGRLLDVS